MHCNQLAIVGATGAVGQEMLQLLEQKTHLFDRIRFFASKRSLGKTLSFMDESIPVEEVTHTCFEGIDAALFSAGGSRSKEFAPSAAKQGCIVIDNSSAFRMDPNVPLVVPEVNPQDSFTHQGIIANPNCSTIIMVLPLHAIHKVNPVKRVIAATYQAVSGAGMKGINELEQQLEQFQTGKPLTPNTFAFPIANNLFSHDTPIQDDGYCFEEQKMMQETRKIMHDPNLAISATCIRVPIFRAHSIALHTELSNPVDLEALHHALSDYPGIQIVDDRETGHFPMPMEASGKNDILVGRIRKDHAWEHGLAFFVAGDQLLKGAALNAVQILEHL